MAKITLYMDCRKKSVSGVYPIVLRVCSDGTSAHIPTHISSDVEHWCKERSELIGREKRQENSILQYLLSEARLKLSDALKKNPSLAHASARTIKGIIVESDTRLECEETGSARVLPFFNRFIGRKKRKKTVEQYRYMMQKLSTYTDLSELTFEDITVSFLRDWHAKMIDGGCRENTCADVEICLRAVMNAAIDEGVISSDLYPFRKYKVRKVATAKRSLRLHELHALMDAEKEPHQKKYWDCFMLSIYLCGINMVDLLNLPAQRDITHIGYNRSKTGIWVEFDVPPVAQDIIHRYKGRERLVNFAESCQDYSDFVNRMNKELKHIGTIRKVTKKTRTGNRVVTLYKPFCKSLSSYWARHTYATIAADLDIPEMVIEMSMAHKSIFPMSEIYIRKNMRKIDEYLPKVVNAILAREGKENPSD